MELKQLLAATIIRYLPNFITLLLEHPQKDFGDSREGVWENHRFLVRIKQACEDAGVTVAQLEEWSNLVERDFIQRNYNFVAFDRVQQHETFRVDTRSLNSAMASLCTHMSSLAIVSEETRWGSAVHQQSVNHEVTLMRQEMAALREDMALVKGSVASYNRKADKLLSQNCIILRTLIQKLTAAGYQQLVQEETSKNVFVPLTIGGGIRDYTGY